MTLDQEQRLEHRRLKRLWPARRMANYLQLRLGRFYLEVQEGKIPTEYIGRHMRWDIRRVRAWLINTYGRRDG